MNHVRHIPQTVAAFALVAFLAACNNGSTAPPVTSPPKGSQPTTAPYSVALACNNPAVADYKPGETTPDRVFKLSNKQRPTAVAYDSSGNLYIGIDTDSDSWVDEYPPGSTTVTRHITDGIHHPGSIVADPDGDLYVANIGILAKNVVMYKPGSTSPDLTINDVRYPLDLVWAQGHLWVADNDANEVRAYHVFPDQSKAILAWIISNDLHGPTALSTTSGNLYVLNVPFVGADYVREYAIANDKAPVFARTINARLHYIKAIATDPDENVYLSEWSTGNSYEVAKYDLNGDFQLYVNDLYKPGSIVASGSPREFYVTESSDSGNVRLYREAGGRFVGTLKKPSSCDGHTPAKLAIMEPTP